MDRQEWLAHEFEAQRPRLRAVAYRMLGSLSEADDAVQDAWLRASRADTDGVENLNFGQTTGATPVPGAATSPTTVAPPPSTAPPK